jgi:hypothetical protein
VVIKAQPMGDLERCNSQGIMLNVKFDRGVFVEVLPFVAVRVGRVLRYVDSHVNGGKYSETIAILYNSKPW